MSIASAIEALSQARVAIAAAISEKGGTVSAGDGYDDFARDIRTIPTGSASISALITESTTVTSMLLRLNRILPVDVSVSVNIDGTVYNRTISSGSYSCELQFDASSQVRTASLSASVPAAFSDMFTLNYPEQITIPATSEIILSVENITATGCRIVADGSPTSDLLITVGDLGSGRLDTDNPDMYIDIEWPSATYVREVALSVSPASDSAHSYVFDRSTLIVPAALRTVDIAIEDITTTGCRFVASMAPFTDIVVGVMLDGVRVEGWLYNDGTECEITWDAATLERIAVPFVEPANDGRAQYVVPGSFTVPAEEGQLTFLEYLETDGISYIDTGYLPKTTSRYTLAFYTPKWNAYSTGQYYWAMGAHTQNLSVMFGYESQAARRVGAYNGRCNRYIRSASLYNYFAFRLNSSVASGNTAAHYKYGSTKIGVPDLSTSMSTFNTAGGTGLTLPTASVLLFTQNNTPATRQNGLPAGARLYGARIYEGSTLVHDYKPARSAAGEYGLYDDVTGEFLGNAGDGSFTGA